jgi:hypothetical protein
MNRFRFCRAWGKVRLLYIYMYIKKSVASFILRFMT